MEDFIFLFAEPAIWVDGVINSVLKITEKVVPCFEFNKLGNCGFGELKEEFSLITSRTFIEEF